MLGEDDERLRTPEETKEVDWASEIAHLAQDALTHDDPGELLARKLRHIIQLANEIVRLHQPANLGARSL
jgi:hypothetical protein